MNARDQLIDEILGEAAELVLRRARRRRFPVPFKYGTAYVVRGLIEEDKSREPKDDPESVRDHWTDRAAQFLELLGLHRTGNARDALDDDLAGALRQARLQLNNHGDPLKRALTSAADQPGGGNTATVVVTALIADLLPEDPLHRCWGTASNVIEAAVASHINLVWAALVRMRVAADPAWLDRVDSLVPLPQPADAPDRHLEVGLLDNADVDSWPTPLLEMASRHGDLDMGDLLYWDDGANLAFIPRALAGLCLKTLEQLGEAATWGDARVKLPPDVFESISRKCWDDRNEPPDNETLDPDRVADSWPDLTEEDRRAWLPTVIYEQFEERFEGLFTSGTRIPNENYEIFEVLEQLGIQCAYDADIERLFSTDA